MSHKFRQKRQSSSATALFSHNAHCFSKAGARPAYTVLHRPIFYNFNIEISVIREWLLSASVFGKDDWAVTFNSISYDEMLALLIRLIIHCLDLLRDCLMSSTVLAFKLYWLKDGWDDEWKWAKASICATYKKFSHTEFPWSSTTCQRSQSNIAWTDGAQEQRWRAGV